MSISDPVFNSPKDWVNKHIEEYIASDGQIGHHWHGVSTLLLTTKGHKSGKMRRTALIYGQDGPNYLIVASNGGATHHPLWYLNLSQNPLVHLQVGANKFQALARTATAVEKARLWPIMSRIFPKYEEYKMGTDRDIPIVILEPR